MTSIKISDSIKNNISIQLGCIEADILVQESSEDLLTLIEKEIEQIKISLTPETIRQMGTVKATKEGYKALGKDPNRYRPSAESLMRRVANGKGLYFINNVVDVLNLMSVKTGYSICGYDASCISGAVELGVGRENEPYEGIGRGELNIENLPVFRDDLGAFGTPTSDSVRTMVTPNTKRILFIFMDFENSTSVQEALKECNELLQTYAGATQVKEYIL